MRKGLKFALFCVLLLISVKGFSVRKVVWEGSAPIGFGTITEVNKQLLGRPIWLVSEKQIQHHLKGELVGSLKVQRRLPWTIVVVAEPPELAGVLLTGNKVSVIDRSGNKRAEVPLFATRLPYLMLPDNVPVQKCMVAVNKVLELTARQGINVKAVWVSQHGEVAVYLPEGFWLKLGNPVALDLKLELGKALYKSKLLQPKTVVDLSALRVIGIWNLEQSPQRR